MVKCESCKNKPAPPENIPYFAHEIAMAQNERTVKRLWITILTLIFLLVGSNCLWLYYESSFEDVVTTTTIEAEQDGAGINIVGGGDVDYGAESEDN